MEPQPDEPDGEPTHIHDLADNSLSKSIFANLPLDQVYWIIPKVCSRWQFLQPFSLEYRESLFIFDHCSAHSLSWLTAKYGLVFGTPRDCLYVNDSTRPPTTELAADVVRLFPNLRHLSLSLTISSPRVLTFLDVLFANIRTAHLTTLNIHLEIIPPPTRSAEHRALAAFWFRLLHKHLKTPGRFPRLRRLTLADSTPSALYSLDAITFTRLPKLEELYFGVPFKWPVHRPALTLPPLCSLAFIMSASYLTTRGNEILKYHMETFLPANPDPTGAGAGATQLRSYTLPFDTKPSQLGVGNLHRVLQALPNELNSLQISAWNWEPRHLLHGLIRFNRLTKLKLDQISRLFFGRFFTSHYLDRRFCPTPPSIPSLLTLSLTLFADINSLALHWQSNFSRSIPLLYPNLQSVEFPQLALSTSPRAAALPLPECADIPYRAGDRIPDPVDLGIFIDFDTSQRDQLVARFRKEFRYEEPDKRREVLHIDTSSDEALEVIAEFAPKVELTEMTIPKKRDRKSLSRSLFGDGGGHEAERTIWEESSALYMLKTSNTHITLKQTRAQPPPGKLFEAFLTSHILADDSLKKTLVYLHVDFSSQISVQDLFSKLATLSRLSYLRLACPRAYFATFPHWKVHPQLSALISLHLDVVLDHFQGQHTIIPCTQLIRLSAVLPKLMNLKFDRIHAPEHNYFAISEADLAWIRSLPRFFTNLRKVWLLRDIDAEPKLNVGLTCRAVDREACLRFEYHLSYQLKCVEKKMKKKKLVTVMSGNLWRMKEVEEDEEPIEPLMLVQRTITEPRAEPVGEYSSW